jgi:MFS family permease
MKPEISAGGPREGAARWSLVHPLGIARRPNERMAIAIAVGAMGTLGFAVTSPILPDLADSFGVSRASIGLVQAAVSIPGVLFSAIIGYLADRFGRRRVVLTALLIFTAFGLAGFVARSYWGLVAVRFCQGIGTSGILGMGIVLIGDTFEGRARTRAMGINITGVTMVAMAGPIVSGLLAVGGTFRAFLIFVIGLPLALWASRMPSDVPKEAVAPPIKHVAAGARAMRRAGTLYDYAGLLVATFSGVFIMHGLGLTVTPLFLDGEFGVSVGVRGFILASFQVGIILVALRVSNLLGRLGTRTTLTIAFWCMAVGTAAAGMAPAAWVIGVALGLAGMGFGIFIPIAQSFAAAAGTDVYRGVSVLVWVTMIRVAQVVGPPTGSQLAEGSNYRLAYFIAAAGMAVLAAAWAPLRRVMAGRVQAA